MKSINCILIWIMSFALFYFVLSCFGMLWLPYSVVISDPAWFLVYSVFIGSWLPIMPAREYYLKHKDILSKIIE